MSLSVKKSLVKCVKDLYAMGLTTSVSGNHSVRFGMHHMWITPSAMPRYNLRECDLASVDLNTGRTSGRPSMEVNMHLKIYLQRKDVNAIVHTHSPYTLAVAISGKFEQVIEEALLVVGEPVIVENRPSGSAELADLVSKAFSGNTRTVVIKNHGVVAAGKDIYQARAIVESLEEWAKVLVFSKAFGGPQNFLRIDSR
jgi:L-fuculose-phosphate aldolase